MAVAVAISFEYFVIGTDALEAVSARVRAATVPAHLLHYLWRCHAPRRNIRVTGSSPDDAVSFRWKDYRHASQARTLTLEADEFLRRFCCTCYQRASASASVVCSHRGAAVPGLGAMPADPGRRPDAGRAANRGDSDTQLAMPTRWRALEQ